MRCIVTCEHASARIPRPLRALFEPAAGVLATHRAYDIGARAVAMDVARRLDAPLFAGRVSRLVVDLNRSPSHPRRFSEWTRPLPAAERAWLHVRFYAPFRAAVGAAVRSALAGGGTLLHVSVHSFTPELDGVVRDVDVGVLYDPARRHERVLAGRLCDALRLAGQLRVRRNAPYRGVADGHVTALRRTFGARYVGIEIEINQRLLATRSGRAAMARACADALAGVLGGR
jgi:predicted N-formylglutamate amidohydrolase